MRIPVLIFALALALAAGASLWLRFDRSPVWRAVAGTPEYFEERAEELLERNGAAAREQAAELFRYALARDPASPQRWSNLGEALADAGQAKTAGYCFRRAAALGPNIPPVLMRAANFHFAAGHTEDALACTRRILGLVRDYDAVVFGTYARMGVPLEKVLAGGFPAGRAPRQAYFRYVLGTGSVADAARVWRWLGQAGEPGQDAAGAYCDFLLARGEYAGAAALWSRSMGRGSPGYPGSNRVFNGGFESEPAKAGLDWRITAVDGVSVEREAGAAHTGAHCLRLTFQARSNLAYSHVAQRVVVDPGTYTFRAFARAERVTTDQGVRFRVFDAESPSRLDVSTGQVTGTEAWKVLNAPVTVRPPTRLLEIELIRRPSLRFDNKIGGTVWIDDVELAPHR